jgi:hypothetical protein
MLKKKWLSVNKYKIVYAFFEKNKSNVYYTLYCLSNK